MERFERRIREAGARIAERHRALHEKIVNNIPDLYYVHHDYKNVKRKTKIFITELRRTRENEELYEALGLNLYRDLYRIHYERHPAYVVFHPFYYAGEERMLRKLYRELLMNGIPAEKLNEAAGGRTDYVEEYKKELLLGGKPAMIF